MNQGLLRSEEGCRSDSRKGKAGCRRSFRRGPGRETERKASTMQIGGKKNKGKGEKTLARRGKDPRKSRGLGKPY